jgi:hypothetical protein
MNHALFIAAAYLVAIFSGPCEREFDIPDTRGMSWFKGNTHTHTTMSDGDSAPEDVARWYKQHGYKFLVLSDHNVFTDPHTLSSLVDSSFLLISGEELTTSFQKKPVHVNGLNIPGVLDVQTDSTLIGTIQKNVDAVRNVDGAPHINHPNFGWAIDEETLLRVNRYRLLEIFNGHPLVNNFGGGGKPGMEEVWDFLLSSGKLVYGIAVDDAHHFKEEFGPARSNPGKGWVVVRAKSLAAAEIIQHLEDGLFYASTGVVLDDIIVEKKRIEIHIKQKSDTRFRTDFIGNNGRLLLRTEENPAVYQLSHDVQYVRAKVYDSGGFVAWVQPIFVFKK